MSESPDLQQDLCIKWHSYLGNLGSAFPKLLADQRFLDVTLACEGQQLRCHKVVLAASSPYLEALLNENPCKHPIIVLPRDIKLWEVQALIDFMYKGEVNVSHAGLAGFVKCAELLQVKGLSCSDDDDSLAKERNARRASTESASCSIRSQEEIAEKENEDKRAKDFNQTERLCSKSTSNYMSINHNVQEELQKQTNCSRIATCADKLELIEENCDDPGLEGKKEAERLVEILCDLPNDTHYANVTQTSIFEHVRELGHDHCRQADGGANNSGNSDLNFDYIEQDECRGSFNETVSEIILNNNGDNRDFNRLELRNRPISEEKSDSDGGTSGYSSLQILDVRSLANVDSSNLKQSSNFPWQPDEANSEDNKSQQDIRVMLSTSLTRAIKRNAMNNRSYAIFRKTVKRHSSFGSRKRKSATNRTDGFLTPSAIVLPPLKQGQVREYDAKAMYNALMEVKAGNGISDASTRHKIPRTTLCNWIKRLNIKVTNGRTRQK